MSRSTTGSLVDRLRPENRVREGTVSLVGGPERSSVTGTIDLEAVRHSGRDPDEPGTVDYFYLRSEQLLVLDLGGQFGTDEDDEDDDDAVGLGGE
jgi:hypothetical protein